MRAVDVIIKKRDGGELSTEEIQFFVNGFTRGEIPDYQASAWAMAVLFRGMNDRETTDLTMAMAHSGDVLDLRDVVPLTVDKHSTGGVGDKTTFVVEPLVAACGLPVGKMSGRGLGFSGGTLDKIESIPGYRTDLSQKEFKDQLGRIGLVLTGQSGDLAPADGKFYALRDVTGTVPSTPLIAASVMSKKIAGGAQAIVLDVKIGLGAFMATLDAARELSRLMVSIGKLSGREVVCVLSDMNQPLGNAVGNALELKEAIDTLHGKGPADFQEHCLVLASHLLLMGKKATSLEQAHQMAQAALEGGLAWEKFRSLVIAQEGDVRVIDDPRLLPQAPIVEVVRATRPGFILGIDARQVGEASVELGAGRARKGDPIDHAVGFVFHHKVGEQVAAGEPLFTIHAGSEAIKKAIVERVLAAYQWSESPCDPLPLFYGLVS